MRIQLSDHFTYSRLIRFVLPSIVMMIFTSIYGIVDGIFVSNFVGETPFAAINICWPMVMLMSAIGFMVGSGGNAVISKAMGEGDDERANKYFSMLIYVTLGFGFLLSAICLLFRKDICIMLGAEGELLENCMIYMSVLMPVSPIFMLQNVFQTFCITAEKPKLGLYITVGAGVTNMILDALFIVVFEWGLIGAAIATAMSQIIGGLFPLVYFSFRNSSRLRLGRTNLDFPVLLKTCTNGVSELMTNISLSLVNILYNYKLMDIAGEDGVNAYGIIMYVNFIFIAVFIGYSIGSAPIIGFNYGAQNKPELQNMFRKSLVLLGGSGVLLTTLAEIFSRPLSAIFVSHNPVLMEMTTHGFRIYSIAFLVMGFNIFASAFFTALGNGLVSAIISFLRTLAFQVVPLMILPIFFGLDGVWAAIVVAEIIGVIVSFAFFAKLKQRYGYA